MCAAAEVATTTTANGGYYSFNTDPTYGYYVRFATPAGYFFTTPDAGDDTLDSDADPITGLTYIPSFPSGPVAMDAGLYLPVEVSGFVWDDLDGDGVREAGEPGLGSTVELLDAGGGIVRLGGSSFDGTYVFRVQRIPSLY